MSTNQHNVHNTASGIYRKTRPIDAVVLITTKAVLPSENMTRFILNVAGAFVTTLPLPLAGLEYEFWCGATVPTTSHTIVTSGSANIMEGAIASSEDAAGSAVFAEDSDTITFLAGAAAHGDHVKLWADGTNWYVTGACGLQDAIAGSQAS